MQTSTDLLNKEILMSKTFPLPLSQKLPIGKLTSLFILGILLTVGFWYKLSKDIESHKISYQAERAAPPEIPEVEEYEYRLMKTQMEFFAKNFPARDSFKDLNVPVLSGPKVISCDNAEFTKKELSEHNDELRKGLLFTVPVYGLERKLHESVSAVIRSQVVLEMLPEKYMALVNRSHKFIATKDNTAAFSENLNNLMNANSKKSQISSGINTIEI